MLHGSCSGARERPKLLSGGGFKWPSSKVASKVGACLVLHERTRGGCERPVASNDAAVNWHFRKAGLDVARRCSTQPL